MMPVVQAAEALLEEMKESPDSKAFVFEFHVDNLRAALEKAEELQKKSLALAEFHEAEREELKLRHAAEVAGFEDRTRTESP